MKRYVNFLGFLLSIFVLGGCAGQQREFNASMYRFQFNDEGFRIRSISASDTSLSYNELIGENVLAVDFDQDRILDYIALGEMRLPEAQKVYETGLNRIAMENLLRVRAPNVHRYVHESNGVRVEIISFQPSGGSPFNEFKMIDQRSVATPEDVVLVDKNADGTLDAVLKGSADLESMQSRYQEAIDAGLQKQELVKVDGAILVKEK